ncbi:MAG: DUF86 domain-containing protein [Clostridia bacterium]|nr:DUF86 domain-containing protein [Clostridia bacterium]
MPAIDRDREIIRHILRYCDQVEAAHDDFGHDRERFDGSTTYQNAIAMCILQIGELVNHLSDGFKIDHDAIPWHRIRGMRNYVAHEYGAIDLDVVWYVADKSIPELKAYCEQYLKH